ncbi:MAG: hypothetical protein J5I59_12505 [Saprospiraceae bacterium]|nr:hypothetical protein [Saprospiraceae bacterium]
MRKKIFMGAFLRPKSIEHFNQRSIYEYLGIRYFKKFLPTTGDLARKRKKLFKLNKKMARLTSYRSMKDKQESMNYATWQAH